MSPMAMLASSAGDSDVEGADAPGPAANAVASLVDIIEADAFETPYSQMYTTLLDKDGKVVGTNDPDRAIDRRYKSVEQGGEGVGLSKGDNVTVHFRMAAVTPNNADGEARAFRRTQPTIWSFPGNLLPPSSIGFGIDASTAFGGP